MSPGSPGPAWFRVTYSRPERYLSIPVSFAMMKICTTTKKTLIAMTLTGSLGSGFGCGLFDTYLTIDSVASPPSRNRLAKTPKSALITFTTLLPRGVVRAARSLSPTRFVTDRSARRPKRVRGDWLGRRTRAILLVPILLFLVVIPLIMVRSRLQIGGLITRGVTQKLPLMKVTFRWRGRRRVKKIVLIWRPVSVIRPSFSVRPMRRFSLMIRKTLMITWVIFRTLVRPVTVMIRGTKRWRQPLDLSCKPMWFPRRIGPCFIPWRLFMGRPWRVRLRVKNRWTTVTCRMNC